MSIKILTVFSSLFLFVHVGLECFSRTWAWGQSWISSRNMAGLYTKTWFLFFSFYHIVCLQLIIKSLRSNSFFFCQIQYSFWWCVNWWSVFFATFHFWLKQYADIENLANWRATCGCYFYLNWTEWWFT